MVEKTQKLDANELRKVHTRRQILKDSAYTGVAAALAGAASYTGLEYLHQGLSRVMGNAERDIKGLVLDVKELSGSLEEKLVTERKKLEEHYTQGVLGVYADLGIAEPAEISEIEQIIKNYEEFEEHYDFAERAKIFKDRLDRRLLTIDDKLESFQPDAMRKVNDAIRGMLGKPTGEKGKRYRSQIQDRLESLCKIYDANSDNRRAQIEVLKTLNGYLELADLSPEEKELYSFLKAQYEQGGRDKELRDFIENYDGYSERNETLLRLRNSLSESESIYAKIKENKDYIKEYQDWLKKGIALKEEIRSKAPEEVEAYKEEFDRLIKQYRDALSDRFSEMKEKGYTIETREKGTYAQAVDAMMMPVKNFGTLLGAGLAGLYTWRHRAKGRKTRALQGALNGAVGKHNELASEHDDLKVDNEALQGRYDLLLETQQKSPDEVGTENYKSPETPEYDGGGGI